MALPRRAVLPISILAFFMSITIVQHQKKIGIIGGVVPYYSEPIGIFPNSSKGETDTPNLTRRTYSIAIPVKNSKRRNYSCHAWEVNTDEWWTHNPEWEISLENETHYCFSPIANNKKAKRLRQLYEIGFSPRANCSNVTTKRMINSGWGADITNVIDGLIHSLSSKQPFQIWTPTLWHYASLPDLSKAACSRRDMFCYFLNISRCAPNPKRLSTGRLLRNAALFYGRPNRWILEYATRSQTWLRRESYRYATQHLMLYRPDYTSDTHLSNVTTSGSTALRRNVSNSSHRMTAANIIKTRVRNEPFPPNASCIPIHVRRADVVLHRKRSRKYHPISAYLQALKNVSTYHHPSHQRSLTTTEEQPYILLLTDDANAIGEALVEHGQYPWMYLDRPRHRGAEGGWENQIPSGDPRKEVIAIEAVRRLVQRCKPPLIHSTSGFADYLRSILEEKNPSSNENSFPPVHVDLDALAINESIKLHGWENAKTVSLSKSY